MTQRGVINQAPTALRTRIAARHVGLGPGFIKEYQPFGLGLAHPFEPRPTSREDLGAQLLLRV